MRDAELLENAVVALPRRRGTVLLDQEDYERLPFALASYLRRHPSKIYVNVVRKNTRDNTLYATVMVSIGLHRIIANTPDGLVTDHVDGDGLNNRRSNLKNVTQEQNKHTTRKRYVSRRYLRNRVTP